MTDIPHIATRVGIVYNNQFLKKLLCCVGRQVKHSVNCHYKVDRGKLTSVANFENKILFRVAPKDSDMEILISSLLSSGTTRNKKNENSIFLVPNFPRALPSIENFIPSSNKEKYVYPVLLYVLTVS